MLFDVQVSEADGWQLLAVVGDVDLANLPRFATAAERLDAPQAAIDLRSVEWFDPVCTGVLVAAALRARRRGGVVSVVVGPSVRRTLEDAGLGEVLELTDELPPHL